MASKLLRRSVFALRPPVAIAVAYRYRPKVDQLFNGVVDIKSYSNTPAAFDRLEPILSSISWSFNDECFKFNIPGQKKTESDESVCVFLNMSGVTKLEDVKLYSEPKSTSDLLLIEGKTHNLCRYIGTMKFPMSFDRTSSDDIKGEIKDGMFKLTLPKVKVKPEEYHKKANIFVKAIANFLFKLSLAYYASIPSCRSHVVNTFCPYAFDSFSMCKEMTAESLNIRCMPRLDKSKFTREGICVSLNMPGLTMEDVKSYIKHEAFFIEGKTKTGRKKVHYIACIRLPKGFRNIIKIEMQDGMYKAIVSDIVTHNVN